MKWSGCQTEALGWGLREAVTQLQPVMAMRGYWLTIPLTFLEKVGK